MLIKIVVACHNASGEPDLWFCIVKCFPSQYDVGEHYDAAAMAALDEGYEGPLVPIAEFDPPKPLFDLFQWETATVVDITGE